MKNLRRIISFMIALCMLVSLVSVSSAAEYSDVSENHKNAEAIGLLSGLGIFKGYGTTFEPDATITRAEAATVIVRVLGCEDEVKKGDTIFSDVSAKDWHSGYVNTAVAHGIINGFPDGTFKPDEPVTYEQIVKMLVCAIGHDIKAQTIADVVYPDGFIRAASDARMTKGVSGYVGMKAPRALVAQLVYNALEIEMMEPVTYSTGALGISYAYNGRTILRDYLEIEKVDAVVTDTYLTKETYSQRDKDIQLDIKKVYTLKNRSTKALYSENEVITFDEGTTDANIYLGKTVTAYVGENSLTGKDTIFAITADSAKNTEVKVTKERFFESDSDDRAIYYRKKLTDRNLTKLELDKNVQVVVNGEIVSKSVEYYFDSFDTMTLIDNDRDNKYEFVLISAFDPSCGVEFVVTDIDKDGKYYCFEGKNGDLEIDLDDDNAAVTIIRDGKIITPDKIRVNDVITCLDASKAILTVYVSSQSVKGTISEVDYDEGEYYIGNKAYSISAAFPYELDPGDYGTFYLNYQGKIAYSTVQSKVTGGDYIFITAYDTQTKFGKNTYYVQAVTASGKVSEYTLKASKMKYISANGVLHKDAQSNDVYNYLKSYKSKLSDTYKVDGYVGIARVKVSSAGVISEIYIPGNYAEFYAQTKYAAENKREYSKRRGTYGVYDLTGREVTFQIDDKAKSLTDAVSAGTLDDFFTDGGNYVFVAYGERGKDFSAVVITDGISAVDYSKNAVLVTKTSKISVDGYNNNTTKIIGLKAGRQVTYIVDPDESFDVKVGNIIIVGENAKGYVSRIEKVANTTDNMYDLYTAFDGADVPSDADAGVFAGMLEDKTTKRFKLEGIDESFYSGTDAVYYLIDYTGRTATFEKSSLSAVKTLSTVDSYIIVRTYEEEVVDVFVFRTKAGKIDPPSVDVWDTVTPAEPDNGEPTEVKTDAPTEVKTDAPTEAKTDAPTEAKTDAPTEAKTDAPTEAKTDAPTEAKTDAPAEVQTDAPTEVKTDAPTEVKTDAPTEVKTDAPTEAKTDAPTEAKTDAPTEVKTDAPTEVQTDAPTEIKTDAPTEAKTDAPTEVKTDAPTEVKTDAPTEATTEDGPVLAGETTQLPTENKQPSVEKTLQDEVIKLINAEREKAGLKALVYDGTISKVSEAHGKDMAVKNYLDQKGKDGATLEARLTKNGVKFKKASENLAKGNYTAKVIVDAWMKSEKHKANILNGEFDRIGVSVIKAADGNIYWVVDFVKQAEAVKTEVTQNMQ